MDPLARYPLRTPPSYWLVLVALSALSLAPLALLFAWAPRGMGAHLLTHPGKNLWIVVVCVLMTAVPFVYWFSTASYRIPGGTGELRLYGDRLERHAHGVTPVVLPLTDLRVHLEHMIVRYTLFHVLPVGEVNRATIATFMAGGRSLVLSDRLFEDRRFLQALLDDLDGVRSKTRAPEGPRVVRPIAPAVPSTDEQFDEQLDRELSELD